MQNLVDILNQKNIFLDSVSRTIKKHNIVKKKIDHDKHLTFPSFYSNYNDNILSIKNHKKIINFLKKPLSNRLRNIKIKSHHNNKIFNNFKKDFNHIHINSSLLNNISEFNTYDKNINYIKNIKDIIYIIRNIKKSIINNNYGKNIQKNTYQYNNIFSRISVLNRIDKKINLNSHIDLSAKNNIKDYSEWKKAISQQLLFFILNRENVAEINIKPKNLNPIYVQIRMKSDKATVNFISYCSQIKKFLNSITPALKSSLVQRGIQVDKINIHSPVISDDTNIKIKKNIENKNSDYIKKRNIENFSNISQRDVKYINHQGIDIYV
ncbi:flagellar hook-length control protein FliK [Buchnera aphidicola]|uniref:flagellar hook-length control protein FliK n=1 Tax=Buchnera aphidicola TaxID=9 RepID=UPI003BEF2A92